MYEETRNTTNLSLNAADGHNEWRRSQSHIAHCSSTDWRLSTSSLTVRRGAWPCDHGLLKQRRPSCDSYRV